MHTKHLAPCLVVVGLGLALFLVTGAGAAWLGTLALFALCPLMMGWMMWSMGGHGGHGSVGKDES
jgi:hypothetical protein